MVEDFEWLQSVEERNFSFNTKLVDCEAGVEQNCSFGWEIQFYKAGSHMGIYFVCLKTGHKYNLNHV